MGFSSEFAKVLKEKPLLSFRRPKNLKDHLVRSKLCREGNQENGMVKCNKKRCQVCNFIRQGDKFRSSVTGRTYYVNHVFDCDSEEVIYLITCKKCGLQYVGNSVTSFRLRFNNHKSSMMRYVDELRISELFPHFDLLALNETRLDSAISNDIVKIRGYDIVRNDRSRKGGGVCIYLRSTISFTIRNDLVPNDIEAVCVEISKPNSRNFIVVSVYRPPSSAPEFFVAFEKMIKMIDDENKELHILGDLNVIC